MVLFTRTPSISEAYALALTMAAALGLASIAEVTQATYLRTPPHTRRNRPDAFVVCATIALTGLAIASVALGAAPLEDPTITIFAAP
jgi:hypothetical protein